MKRPAYDSPSLPISWKRIQYVAGTREGVRVFPDAIQQVMEYYKNDPEAMKEALGENPYELSNIIDRWILNENPELQIIPTDSIVITVDKEAVKRSGMMIADDSIPDVMHISLKGRGTVYKSELMMYEMLARSNWERPLYVAITVGESNYGDLGKNFVREGLADRITPFNTEKSGKTLDSEKTYDNLMNKFKFGGLDNPDIYLDETVMRMCYTHRRIFGQLGQQLLREGKKDKALKLMEKAEKAIPAYNVPHGWQGRSLDLARTWLALGKNQKGEEIASSVIGIGINLNQTDFPELSNATSVKIITGNSFSVEDALELFCKEFGKTISLLGSNSLSETYEEKLFQKGRLCRYSDYIRDREFDGIIKGVTESGRLIVKEGEEERTYAFKEIGYIL